MDKHFANCTRFGSGSNATYSSIAAPRTRLCLNKCIRKTMRDTDHIEPSPNSTCFRLKLASQLHCLCYSPAYSTSVSFVLIAHALLAL